MNLIELILEMQDTTKKYNFYSTSMSLSPYLFNQFKLEIKNTIPLMVDFQLEDFENVVKFNGLEIRRAKLNSHTLISLS